MDVVQQEIRFFKSTTTARCPLLEMWASPSLLSLDSYTRRDFSLGHITLLGPTFNNGRVIIPRGLPLDHRIYVRLLSFLLVVFALLTCERLFSRPHIDICVIISSLGGFFSWGLLEAFWFTKRKKKNHGRRVRRSVTRLWSHEIQNSNTQGSRDECCIRHGVLVVRRRMYDLSTAPFFFIPTILKISGGTLIIHFYSVSISFHVHLSLLKPSFPSFSWK